MPEDKLQEERTESATPRRREEARKKGQVAKSAELTSVFMFLMGLVSLKLLFPYMFNNIKEFAEYTFGNISRGEAFENCGFQMLFLLSKVLGPFSILMVISALVINYAQVGLLLSPEALLPKFDRIDPVKGWNRMFSKRTIIALAQSFLKLIVVGYVVYVTIKNDEPKILGLADMQIRPAVVTIVEETFKMAYRAGFLLLGMAILDYAYQRWEYEQSLRMTRQEVREELRNTEGDPLIKSRIRSIQRQLAMNRMMQAVPKAAVVITNPTHIAVALKYDREVDQAPKVCAKGKNLIAEKIKAIAYENDVPVVENPPLAQALYKLDIDQEIPVSLYKAVAEILARIYAMNNRNSEYNI